jgi:hypothetical protein
MLKYAILVCIAAAAFAGETPELIQGRYGTQLLYRGYCYRNKRTKITVKTWQCLECRTSLTTSPDGTAVIFFHEHSHPPDFADCQARKARSELVRSIRANPQQATTQLCRKSLVTVPCTVKVESVARNLRYHRSKLRPRLPRNVAELVIPQYLTVTTRQDRFLLLADTLSTDPIVIYCSDFSLRNLCTSSVICGDGTFACTPGIFQQLYTLSYFYNEKLLPAVFVLTQRRTRVTYGKIMDTILLYFRKRWLQDVHLWNVHGKTTRTNNDMEGWHFSLSQNVRKHCDIYQFLSFIREEESVSYNTVRTSDTGVPIKRQEKKFRDKAKKIGEITAEYVRGSRTKLSFLKACAFVTCPEFEEHRGRQNADKLLVNFPELLPELFHTSGGGTCSGIHIKKQQAEIVSTPDDDCFVCDENVNYEISSSPLSALAQMNLCLLLGLPFVRLVHSGLTVPRSVNIRTRPAVIATVAGDGNCLFRSFSYLLAGCDSSYALIRTIICNYISTNFTGLGVGADYVQRNGMHNNGEWGTEVEIMAFASLTRSDVYVYSSVGAPDGLPRWLRFRPNLNLPGVLGAYTGGSFCINHAGQSHYEPVLDI